MHYVRFKEYNFQSHYHNFNLLNYILFKVYQTKIKIPQEFKDTRSLSPNNLLIFDRVI